MITINSRSRVMLIDTSYYIFYRYFAVYNWMKLARPEDTIRLCEALNGTFLDKFDKTFVDSLKTLAKKHKVAYPNVVFVKDCSRDSIWRCEHYADYKKGREDRLGTFNADIFRHCYGKLLPAVKAQFGVQDIEIRHAEADDIACVVTRTLNDRYPDTEVVIVTNDNDYLQLVGTNTSVFNLKHIDLSTRLKGTAPKVYLQTKILMGDKSDNIPAVFPKCGEKTASALVCDPERLEKQLAQSASYAQQFALNTLLIDMAAIPQNIQDAIRGCIVLT